MARARNRGEVGRSYRTAAGAGLLAGLMLTGPAAAQCPEEPLFANYTNSTQSVCPCFVTGEEAGAIFDVPASHYPIEVLRVQFHWGSQFGGAPQSLESAIHLYAAGLPNPGVPQFSLPGPVLTDGFVNEFDFAPIPGNKIINSGPFTVTLEFQNTNAGMIFSPSMVLDSGCQPGKNVVKAVPGGWNDACALGVSGDWYVGLIYRRVNCTSVATYCTGKTNSLGCVPFLTSNGAPSASATTAFQVIGNDMIPGEAGFLLYSFKKSNLNFHGGKLCVKAPVSRLLPPKVASGTGTPPCSGFLKRNLNATIQSGSDPLLTPGQTVNVQWRQRDPADPAGFGDSLTDGLNFTINP